MDLMNIQKKKKYIYIYISQLIDKNKPIDD